MPRTMQIPDGNIWVQESYINLTEGYRFGDSEVLETYTDDTGQLYRDCVKEYGRCVSSIYVDSYRENGDGRPVKVGWVFHKRMQYEDSTDTYLREVWVTLHSPAVETVDVPREVHPVLAIGRMT